MITLHNLCGELAILVTHAVLPDEVPQNIMQQVLPKMAPKMMDGNIFKAEKIAPYLVAKGMISYDEFYEITNKCINPSDRAQKVYAMLPSKGNGALTLVRFYHCLIESAQKDRLESHYTIACELRLLGKCYILNFLCIIKTY